MTNANLIMGSMGFLFITGILLALAGFGASTLKLPTETPVVVGETQQSFIGQVLECAITIFTSCEETVETQLFATISNIVGWALAAFSFLFQLFTFQIDEIPVYLNAMIVVPPAIALAYIAFISIRGGS